MKFRHWSVYLSYKSECLRAVQQVTRLSQNRSWRALISFPANLSAYNIRNVSTFIPLTLNLASELPFETYLDEFFLETCFKRGIL